MYRVTLIFNDMFLQAGRMAKFTTECADHAAFIIENARPMIQRFYVTTATGTRIDNWPLHLAEIQRNGGGNYSYIVEVRQELKRLKNEHQNNYSI